MADTVRKENYCYLFLPNRAGQAASVLGAVKDAGINLLAVMGFPDKGGRSQFDMVAEDSAALRRVAKKNGWRLSSSKKAFIVEGGDARGAVQRHLQKLGAEKVNITAVAAVCAGKGRYGMILWVKPKDYNRAAVALGAR